VVGSDEMDNDKLQEIAEKTGKTIGEDICIYCGDTDVRKSRGWDDDVVYNCDICEMSWR